MQDRISPVLPEQSEDETADLSCYRSAYAHTHEAKPLVSIVTPAYNEAAIILSNLVTLCDYLKTLESEYRWELILVNDGSKDETGWLAEEFARTRRNIHVWHHRINLGLGRALKTGFSKCQGDYIIVMDLDLSYDPEHIGRLLHHIRETQAGVVVASPYMAGGSISNVPWLRKTLSIWANRFLSVTAKHTLATLTGMVRVYDAQFLQSLNLRSLGMDINPEIIHKALLLLTPIAEIPGHLHWHQPKTPPKGVKKRRSSMKLLRHTWDILFSGFLLRPVMFFIIPSFMFFVLSLYANAWVLIHCWTHYQILQQQTPFPDPTVAVAQAFAHAPHTFFIGGITLMLGVQLFSLGILSAQNKNYFEELFYLNTAIYRRSTAPQSDEP